MKKLYDERGVAIAVIAALYHHEISEGCAMEILEWTRMQVREARDNFVPTGTNDDDALNTALRVLGVANP